MGATIHDAWRDAGRNMHGGVENMAGARLNTAEITVAGGIMPQC
jgi:hypothetical protein